MAQAGEYKKQRAVNVVTISILLVVIAVGVLLWKILPLYFRKSEVKRVLDETSSTFGGQSARYLAVDKELRYLESKMSSQIAELGVSDPNQEAWIEVDDEHHVRFGALYSDWLKLPFMEPREDVQEIEMECARTERGANWICRWSIDR